LLELIDHVDPLVMPLVIDEIGRDLGSRGARQTADHRRRRLAPRRRAYLRVKAIEALGRIHAPESTSTLKRLVEAKKVFGWVQPEELRIAALQALEKLDPDWFRDFLPRVELTRKISR